MRATKCSNLFSFILTNLTSLRALEKFTTWEDLLKNPLIKFGVAENHSLAVPNDSNGCAEFLQREYELDDYFNNCLAELSRSQVFFKKTLSRYSCQVAFSIVYFT